MWILRKISFLTLALLTAACLGDDVSGSEENEEEPPPIQHEAVSPDGILETVTWNLEWFGGTGENQGPEDIELQRDNAIEVMDSLQADLYAFQEILDKDRLSDLTARIEDYDGFVAEYMTFFQKTAFVYNTQVIDSVDSGRITEGQSEDDWAGRYPMFFEFDYSYQDITIPVYAVVIHGKANTGANQEEREDAYKRRKRAAASLYEFLQSEKPDTHVIILGDYNDDLDESIYDGESPSPYKDFVENEQHYFAVTKSITEKEQSSYIAGDYNDLIDHIIVSDEVEPYYVEDSEEIYFEALDFIEAYEATTSDHLPVWSKFDITK